MTTQTLSLTDFLLARISEDEARAHNAQGAPGGAWGVANLPAQTYQHVVEWGPNRVLAECGAKRAIVTYHAGKIRRSGAYKDTELMLLGRVYADHPDYQSEWA